jgi:Uri superfamily endonuclease
MARGTTATSYRLRIEVRGPIRCRIGRLGVFEFPAGTYLYAGSAKRGIEARIARHLRKHKRFRWHIDYLLAAPGVQVTQVSRSVRAECDWNQASRGKVLVAGFGASDGDVPGRGVRVTG